MFDEESVPEIRQGRMLHRFLYIPGETFAEVTRGIEAGHFVVCGRLYLKNSGNPDKKKKKQDCGSQEIKRAGVLQDVARGFCGSASAFHGCFLIRSSER